MSFGQTDIINLYTFFSNVPKQNGMKYLLMKVAGTMLRCGVVKSNVQHTEPYLILSAFCHFQSL
jgi:hypothetical protein